MTKSVLWWWFKYYIVPCLFFKACIFVLLLRIIDILSTAWTSSLHMHNILYYNNNNGTSQGTETDIRIVLTEYNNIFCVRPVRCQPWQWQRYYSLWFRSRALVYVIHDNLGTLRALAERNYVYIITGYHYKSTCHVFIGFYRE